MYGWQDVKKFRNKSEINRLNCYRVENHTDKNLNEKTLKPVSAHLQGRRSKKVTDRKNKGTVHVKTIDNNERLWNTKK